MAATEVADVSFLKRRRKPDQTEKKMQARPQDAAIAHADLKLEDLKRRVRELEGVKAVVTIKTRPLKQ